MSGQQNLLSQLRRDISKYTHADEKVCVENLLKASVLTPLQRERIVAKGRTLVAGCREDSDKAGMLDAFMQQYSLSSKEGVAMMCLAEALLRVPDAQTADELIAEKILSGDWADHQGQSDSLFVNASTWGLMLTGRVVHLESEIVEDTETWLKKLVTRMGEPVVRGAVRQAMKIMGQQYVLGRDIEEAINRGKKENAPGTRFSFDMLGEGARTMADANRYYDNYLQAIRNIGQCESSSNVIEANGISVKFSALHPRYQFVQRERVMAEMLPRIRELALEAKGFGIGFTIDAEEADRLDISLDIFEALVRDPALSGWGGLGFVLQAYGKRATFVAEWLAALARDAQQKIMVRLVKGAYWDSEIKHAQEQGYHDYPVYTRKSNTDLSYQVCAAKLLAADDVIYPQFATHNAHTAALILELAQGKDFEFQRLHGMGDLLHLQLAKGVGEAPAPVRVYAPVGAHKDLLPYLVRRLLENGANSSFVNRFLDKKVPVVEVIGDVQEDVDSSKTKRHSSIPRPVNIYRAFGEERPDTSGIDLANANEAQALISEVTRLEGQQWSTGPIIGGETMAANGEAVTCPADLHLVLGTCRRANEDDVHRALDLATKAQQGWSDQGGAARAEILDRAADEMAARMHELIALISFEAGRTLDDGISEVREAVDFLRYYAMQARAHHASEETITGPLGEVFEHRMCGRGVFFCISPWNFPLAIFTGQIAAALAAGNSVIAKPADTTPLIAAEAVKILLKAGVPGEVLHFLPGSGRLLGGILNSDPRVKGVAFTGSTEVAQSIQRALIERGSEVPVFIAETGGQNCMIVDSTALPEQVVDDVVRSAFLSAGQRCSALRVLYVQEEIADGVIEMLKGAMQELSIGQPWQLATDVGPVIDEAAKAKLLQHVENMQRDAKLHYACPLSHNTEQGTFVAPHLFELRTIKQLPGEVFGPILHVIRYNKAHFETVINEIDGTGFGLTLGVHSRIQSFADEVVDLTRVGNNYINRNMVGAVVGVNPFGGQGLSGTGPKAGGPNYLPRFAREELRVTTPAETPVDKVIDAILPDEHSHNLFVDQDVEQLSFAMQLAHEEQFSWDILGGDRRALLLDKAAVLLESRSPNAGRLASICRYYADQARQKSEAPVQLPGPTGETNELKLHGRGVFFCAVVDEASEYDFAQQVVAALAAGNAIIAQASERHTGHAAHLILALKDAGVPRELLQFVPPAVDRRIITGDHRVAGIAWSGPVEEALAMQLEISERGGSIVPMIVEPGGPNYFQRFTVEKTKTVNVVATGGNALLLNLNE